VLGAHCREEGIDLTSQRVAVQGFGNVGSWFSHELHALGAKVVAVSDVHGGVFSERGLDIPLLRSLADDGRPLADAPGVEAITNDELLAIGCDVLVPAALGRVITEDNADAVQAAIVLEAANHPVTPHGDKLLGDRGIVVIPDILANAGGVAGSYFEWTQNIQQFTWKEERFNQELQDLMTVAYTATRAAADDYGCTLRRAAFALGIERVAAAARLRGYV
jgi:glutamate dehydrogenase (NAD(P)+)